ncbi:Epsin-3, clathrin recruitment and traffic between the Golgi and endosome, partial [Tulasnella sp. 403]
QQFNEIMPCIYSRFMEKEANQWRQIYKALQLLEYIVKHGSERVVDDARSHLSTIKMLRNFHYIDDNGKDQGINVRNRSKELAELLTDLDRIRQERRRAKANRNKYIGSGNDGLSFTSASGSRYGGFGSDEVGSSSGYGGGYDRDWGNGSSRSGGFKDDSGRKGYEEYDAGDDEDKSTSAVDHRRSESLSRANLGSVALPRKAGDPAPARGSAIKSPAAPPAPEKSAKVFDLLGFDADDAAATTSTPAVTASATSKHAPSASLDDDFDDFQSATPVATVAPSLPPATTSAPKAGNVFDFLGGAAAPAPPPTSKPPAYTPPIQPQNATSVFTMGNLAPAMQPQQSQSAFASFSKPQQPAMGMGMATPLSPVSSTSGAGAANASRPNYYSSGSSMEPHTTKFVTSTSPLQT